MSTPRAATGRTCSAGPRKLDLTSSYTLPVGEHRSLKFYVRVQNALNQTYYEDGFRTPQAWASGGLKFLFEGGSALSWTAPPSH